MDRGTVPACDVAAVVALNPSFAAIGLTVHWAATAGAQKDRSQRIGVLGPGFAGAAYVVPLDLLASVPGLLVDQNGVEALDELAFDQHLAGIRGVADQILEDVAGEDDRLRAVVIGLAIASVRSDAGSI